MKSPATPKASEGALDTEGCGDDAGERGSPYARCYNATGSAESHDKIKSHDTGKTKPVEPSIIPELQDAVGLISGGKDGLFAIYAARSLGYRVRVLAHLEPKDGVQEANSFMYQSVGSSVVPLIAECMGLPLVKRRVTGLPVALEYNYEATEGDEVEDLKELLRLVKHEYPSVRGVVTGAILSNYQRVRVEHACRDCGLLSVAPLWRIPQRALLRQMMELQGYKPVIAKVAAYGLKVDMLGKPLRELQDDLLALREKVNLHLTGEGGEYETLVVDSPLFRFGRVDLGKMDVVVDVPDEVAPVAFVVAPEASIVKKHGETEDSHDLSWMSREAMRAYCNRLSKVTRGTNREFPQLRPNCTYVERRNVLPPWEVVSGKVAVSAEEFTKGGERSQKHVETLLNRMKEEVESRGKSVLCVFMCVDLTKNVAIDVPRSKRAAFVEEYLMNAVWKEKDVPPCVFVTKDSPHGHHATVHITLFLQNFKSPLRPVKYMAAESVSMWVPRASWSLTSEWDDGLMISAGCPSTNPGYIATDNIFDSRPLWELYDSVHLGERSLRNMLFESRGDRGCVMPLVVRFTACDFLGSSNAGKTSGFGQRSRIPWWCVDAKEAKKAQERIEEHEEAAWDETSGDLVDWEAECDSSSSDHSPDCDSTRLCVLGMSKPWPITIEFPVDECGFHSSCLLWTPLVVFPTTTESQSQSMQWECTKNVGDFSTKTEVVEMLGVAAAIAVTVEGTTTKDSGDGCLRAITAAKEFAEVTKGWTPRPPYIAFAVGGDGERLREALCSILEQPLIFLVNEGAKIQREKHQIALFSTVRLSPSP